MSKIGKWRSAEQILEFMLTSISVLVVSHPPPSAASRLLPNVSLTVASKRKFLRSSPASNEKVVGAFNLSSTNYMKNGDGPLKILTC